MDIYDVFVPYVLHLRRSLPAELERASASREAIGCQAHLSAMLCSSWRRRSDRQSPTTTKRAADAVSVIVEKQSKSQETAIIGPLARKMLFLKRAIRCSSKTN